MFVQPNFDISLALHTLLGLALFIAIYPFWLAASLLIEKPWRWTIALLLFYFFDVIIVGEEIIYSCLKVDAMHLPSFHNFNNWYTCIQFQANTPKEIADYLNKMGARVPNIKPGKATIKYLTKIQASTRFWGMSGQMFLLKLFYYNLPRQKYALLLLLLSLSSSISLLLCYENCAGGLLLCFLATSSSILDHCLRRINEGFAIGFTSVLIIVSPLISGIAFLLHL